MAAPAIKKVVLAYSGGLDTSIILKWLQTEYGAEVVTFTADLGQGEELLAQGHAEGVPLLLEAVLGAAAGGASLGEVALRSDACADGLERILDGEVGMIVNTPSGSDARADGYAIRAAGTSMNAPILTTVQELAAAVQAIEAGMQGEFSVKSLQEHAADLNLFAAR